MVEGAGFWRDAQWQVSEIPLSIARLYLRRQVPRPCKSCLAQFVSCCSSQRPLRRVNAFALQRHKPAMRQILQKPIQSLPSRQSVSPSARPGTDSSAFGNSSRVARHRVGQDTLEGIAKLTHTAPIRGGSDATSVGSAWHAQLRASL